MHARIDTLDERAALLGTTGKVTRLDRVLVAVAVFTADDHRG